MMPLQCVRGLCLVDCIELMFKHGVRLVGSHLAVLVQEDMEHLFTKVRDMALSKQMTESDAERLRHLVEGLRAPHGSHADRNTCTHGACNDSTGDNKPVKGRRAGKLDNVAESLDSEALHHELQSAKRMLQSKLSQHGWRR